MVKVVKVSFPQSFVVPILGVHPRRSQAPNAKRAFLGTGFFVGTEKISLITCRHVVTSWLAEHSNGSFCYAARESEQPPEWPENSLTMRELGEPTFHPTIDVAAFPVLVDSFVLPSALNFSLHPFEDALACEYSETHAYPGLEFRLRTRFHKGNVIGSSDEGGVKTLYTSFPWPSGASGGALFVMRGTGLCVAGMLTGETEEDRFLVRRDTNEGEISEYYTRTPGKAIGAPSLAKALDDLHVGYEINDEASAIAVKLALLQWTPY